MLPKSPEITTLVCWCKRLSGEWRETFERTDSLAFHTNIPSGHLANGRWILLKNTDKGYQRFKELEGSPAEMKRTRKVLSRLGRSGMVMNRLLMERFHQAIYIYICRGVLPGGGGERAMDRFWSPLHQLHSQWTKMWLRSEPGPLQNVFDPLNRAVNSNSKCAFLTNILWASRVPVLVHILLSEPTSVAGVVTTSQRALLCYLTPCIMCWNILRLTDGKRNLRHAAVPMKGGYTSNRESRHR